MAENKKIQQILGGIIRATKLMTVCIAGITPIRSIRILIYKWLLGYRMQRGAYIGFLTFLDAQNVSMGKDAYISGVFNLMHRVGDLTMEPYSKIGCPLIGLNIISGDNASRLVLGRGARVTWGHFFDVSADLTIGPMTIIGGKGCEFFTHDMYNGKRFGPIEIGKECYVGSGVKFGPGARIGDRCVVAMGAVVTKAHSDNDVLLGGVPARVVSDKHGYDALKTYDSLDLSY